MNKDRLEALLWARVDGTIDPESEAELEAHFVEHPENRKVERQITAMAEGLLHLEQEDPPSILRERIKGAVKVAKPPRPYHERSTTALDSRSKAASLPKWLPLAASLLIGVAIGYLLHPGAGGSIDRAGVTGSMMAPSDHPATGLVEIPLDAGAGSIVASRDGADVVISVRLNTEIAVAVALGSAGGPVRFKGLLGSNASTTEVRTDNGVIVLRAVGPGTATVSISAIDAAEPLRIDVSSGGLMVGEHWIDLLQKELKP